MEGEKNLQFLFSRPVLTRSWEVLQNEGIQYLMIAQREKSEETFYETLENHALLLKTFTPYWDSKKIYASDSILSTAAPLLSDELYSRSRLGYPIQVYQLK